MIDSDKTFGFSTIQRIEFEYLFSTNIFPNPASDRFVIETADWEMVRSVKIYNLCGVNVQTAASSGLLKSIDVKSIPAGVYIIELSLRDGQRKMSKIVIAR